MKTPSLGDQIKINKYKLDDECVEQASFYHYWADLQADAKATVDRAENTAKLVEAEAQSRVKLRMEKAGDKITVDAVAAGVLLDSEVRAAKEALLVAREELYHLDAAVRAMDHRKSELDNLVKLWAASYFSQPEGAGLPRPEPTREFGNDQRRALNRKKGEDE